MERRKIKIAKPTLKNIPSASERSPSRTIHKTFMRAGFFSLSKVFISCMKRFLVTSFLIWKIIYIKMLFIPIDVIHSSISSKVLYIFNRYPIAIKLFQNQCIPWKVMLYHAGNYSYVLILRFLFFYFFWGGSPTLGFYLYLSYIFLIQKVHSLIVL